MKLHVLKGGRVDTIEELTKYLENAVDELNGTKKGPCWVCLKMVDNWGVLLPENARDGLGLGSNDPDSARIVFFPFCTEHDLNDAEIIKKLRVRLVSLRDQLSN